MQPLIKISFLSIILSAFIFTSCSKNDPGTPPVADPCAGKNIIITATPISASICGGTIDAAATGSTGFTYKLNSSGTYQASGTFSNVVAGTYTLFAKDVGGCEKSAAVTVQSAGTAGLLFAQLKTLVAAKCQSCHNNTTASGGVNWELECDIITYKTRIKVRAVDEGTMPPSGPITVTEKKIITDWLTAGGGYAN